MQDIRQKYSYIKEKVEKRVFDTYLLKYIDPPIIDEDKLLILISIMDRLDLSFKEMENYAVSTMLIQIALDTHEHILTFSADEKRRQLTVLAGDYFSGLYYKLLAESEDISMIKSLSKGVKAVNEHKISLYHHESKEIEKLITSIQLIESSLLAKLSEYFKVDLWNDFLANLFLFKRLLHEKQQFIRGEESIVFKALKKMIFSIDDFKKSFSKEQSGHLIRVCDNYLEISKQKIEKGIMQLPYLNDFLESRITAMLKQHQPYVKTFAEEG